MKILIVDDDRLGLRTTGFLVKKLGYDVLSAKNGREALEIWRQEAPPVVLSDWNMPEMTGVELLRAIRSDTESNSSYTYFILISERGEKSDIVEGFGAGADDYLAKPVDKDELAARLRTGERIIKMELDLIAAKREAEKATETKSLFLANMSHEIRTPMNGVTGMLSLLAQTKLDAKQHDYVNMATQSAESLLQIINDILDFSKIEAGKLDLERMSFDLRRTIIETSEIMDLRAAEKEISLITRYRPQTPVRVFGDPGRVRQVLYNVLGNAIKFTDKGYVLLDVRYPEPDGEAPGHFELVVQDTGIGISPDRLNTIFEEFKQADSSTTRRYGGTGLGLSITKRLVDMMGGTVEVTSQKGHGAIFTIRIPLEVDPSTPSDQSLDWEKTIAGRRLLVFEELELNRQIIAEQLDFHNVQADFITTKTEMIREIDSIGADSWVYDAVVLDSRHSVELAEDLAGRLKAKLGEHPLKLAVIMANGIRGDARRLQDAGYNAYLVKPVRISLFNEVLGRLFNDDTSQDDRLITRHSIEEAKQANQPSNPLKILVAEDNEVNQHVIRGLLESLGHHCTIVENGAKAIEKVQTDAFDFVFMDVHMPEVDGLTATREIRAMGGAMQAIPIVALTASVMAEDIENCEKAGMTDFLSKPINREAICRVLDSKPEMQAEPPKATKSNTNLNHHIDMDELSQRLEGDEEFINIVLQSFLENTPKAIALLSDALKADNADDILLYSHRIKGGAATVSATTIFNTALKMETHARAGEIDQVRQYLPTLSKNFRQLVEALQRSEQNLV